MPKKENEKYQISTVKVGMYKNCFTECRKICFEACAKVSGMETYVLLIDTFKTMITLKTKVLYI